MKSIKRITVITMFATLGCVPPPPPEKSHTFAGGGEQDTSTEMTIRLPN